MTEKPRYRVQATSDGQVRQVSEMNDGYGNVIAGIGQGRDKPSRGFYYNHTYSDVELVAAYETSFLPRRIVDTVAEDATRRWRKWTTEKDLISPLEKEEQRSGILKAVEKAIKNARLLGGCAVYFPVRGQKADTPFVAGTVGKGDLRRVILFPQNELREGELDQDFDSENFGKPTYYILGRPDGTDVKIHHSRLMIFTGDERPLGLGRETNYWGRSILQTVLNATKNVDGSVSAIATLILEARIDVINIKGLMAQLAGRPGYEQELLKRFGMASMSKSVNGTLILDEGEQYQQKSQTYGSLPELLDRFFQYVSGACGIPVTRLFGTSPGGMNATGESDIRHYYDRVQTLQNNTITPAMANFDEALIRSALGRRPKGIFYTWRSLWQTTEKENSDIALNIAKTGDIMVKSGMIDSYSMGHAVVTSLGENESMPGIEEAWELHQTVRNAPVEAVDLNAQAKAAIAKAEAKPGEKPANSNSSPAPAKKAVNDERPPRPLYVSRKVTNAKAILTWARSQGIEDLFDADDLHVTILYSKTPVDWMAMGEADMWTENGNLTIIPGGPRDVDIFGDDTLVLRFNSRQLKWRHEEMREAGASSDYGDYKAHISITKSIDGLNLDNIKPYTGVIELGPEIFEEIKDDS